MSKKSLSFFEYFNEKNISYDYSSGQIIMPCPFCEKKDRGTPLATFNIDDLNGEGICGSCNKKADLKELIKKMGFEDEILEIDSGFVVIGEKTTDSFVGDKFEQKPSTQNNSFKFQSISDILRKDYGETEWLVDKIIPIETVNIISGEPQNYKTWITMELAKCVASGKSFLDHFDVIQGAVLVIDEEDSERTVKKRFSSLGITEDSTLPLYYLNQAGFRTNDLSGMKIVVDFVKNNNIKLVVFDSLVRIHTGDENSAKDMSNVLRTLQEIVKCGATVILTHHHRKGAVGSTSSQNLRGSSDILAGVDMHMVTVFKKDENCIYLEQTKLRQDELTPPFKVLVKWTEENENKYISLSYAGNKDLKSVKEDSIKYEIFLIFSTSGNEEICFEYIKENLNDEFKDLEIRNVLKNMVSKKELTCKKGAHNKSLYSLPTNG
jgi:hypothetical protein